MSSNNSQWWSASGSNDVDLSWWFAEEEEDNNQESAFGKSQENEKDCSIYVIDCNESMFETDDEKSNSFSRCCQAIVNAFKRKIIQSKDDLVSIVLYNTRESENPMKHSFIYVYSPPDTPSAKLIKNVRDLPLNADEDVGSLSNDKQCDFRDLLWTLQSIFSDVDVQGTKFGSKRALIFTMNDNPMRKDDNATCSKAQDMLDAGIEISVFPLLKNDNKNIKDEKDLLPNNNQINNLFNLKRFYMKICSMDQDELTSAASLYDVCATLNDLENGLRTKEMKKRSIISCPFTIGKDNNIAINLYSLYRRATKDNPVFLDARTNEPLTTETRWLCKDSGEFVDFLSMKFYHEYSPAKQRIYFNKDEMKQLKTFGQPSLVLLGFKPIERLKCYHNFKPSYFMYPNESRIEGSTVLFNSLITILNETNRFAIARFIFRKVGVPRFVALLPQIEIINNETQEQEQPPGINVIFLPFADDIRKPDIKQFNRATDNENNEIIITYAKQIIDKLTMKTLPEPANPVLQKHYDALEAIALEEEEDDNNNDNNNNNNNENEDDLVMDDDYVDYDDEITPNDEAMIRLAGEYIEKFKNALNLSNVPSGASNASKKRTKAQAGIEGGGKRAKAAKKNKNENASQASDFDWKKLAENDELSTLKNNELKIYLGENGLKKGGKKVDLIARIKEHLGV